MHSRLDRLFALLETGTTSVTRKAAAGQLGELVRLHSLDLNPLLDRLHKYIVSKSWDTRVAAGYAILAISENVSQWDPSPVDTACDSNDLNVKLESMNLQSFNIKNVLESGSYLSGGTEGQFQVGISEKTGDRITEQRNLINKSLGLDIAQAIGINTDNIFSNEDLIEFKEKKDKIKKETTLNIVKKEMDGNNKGVLKRKDSRKRISTSDMDEIHGQKRPKLTDEESCLLIKEADNKLTTSEEVWPFSSFCDKLIEDLFNSSWEIRHGAAIALKEIVNVQGRIAGRKEGCTQYQMNSDNQLWLENKAVRTLSVIAMDRFVDFVSDDAVAPIRESCSQLLGSLVKFMSPSSVMEIQCLIHEMLQWEDWGTRHGGMLALKYILAVRSDLKKKIFMDSYQYIFKGLKDSVDDVIAQAASCFMFVSDEISSLLNETELNVLLSTLWKSLLDFDGISGALKSMLDLLSNIFKHSTITNRMTIDSLSHVRSLWPFMYENSSKVRSAALRTISSLFKGKIVQSECSSSHMNDLIHPLMLHIFQSLIIENNVENMDLSVQIWKNILEYSQLSKVQEVAIKYYAAWMTLLVTNPKSTLDGNIFVVPSIEANYKKQNNIDEIVDVPSKKYMLGCGYTVVTSEKFQLKYCIQAKMYGAKLLGILANYAVQDMGNEFPTGERPMECFHQMLLTYLTSQSAWGRQLVALVLCEWAEHHSVQCLPLKDDLYKALSEMVYYNEVAWNCAKLQRQTKDFIAMLKVYSLEVGPPYQDLTIFTMEQINKLTGEIVKHLIANSKLRKKCLDQLEQRREELILITAEVTKDHAEYTLLVQSSLACAVIALDILPEKLTPLVKPLMESIRKHENEYLQEMSARYLPQLMKKCCKRQACPNIKIYKNLCLFLCVDDSVTPAVTDNITLPSNGIYYLTKQEENNKSLSRCSSLTGRTVGRPRSVVGDTSEVNGSTLIEEQNVKVIQRRGCTKALINIIHHFGPDLQSELEYFHQSLIKPLMGDPTIKIETTTDVRATIQWFQLLEIIIPHLSPYLLDELVDYIQSFCIFLFHKFSVIRHMAARVFAVLTLERMNPCLVRLVNNVIPNLELPATDTCLMMKEGVLEYIYFTIEKLELKILPFLILLIVPLLARMSDNRKSIREMATQCFATLIRLYPLDSPANKCDFMPPHLISQRSAQRIFLDQLADPSKLDTFVIPVEIKANLRPYQQEGINWLAFLNRYNLHGILCDDMGLGKTLQSICILAADHHAKKINKFSAEPLMQGPVKSLIVCPSTLTAHWFYEIKKFVSPNILKPLEYSGFLYERKRLRLQVDQHDVIIASYKIVRNELDDFFSKYKWNYIILDEGHIIKNGKTKSSMAIKSLEGEHRLILSGTPIQNNVIELWSLFDFLMPGYLGSERQFNINFSRPIIQSWEAKASSRDQEAGVLAMEKLHRQTLPFILRRIKEDVLKDLPPKIIQDYYCELSPLQKELYEDFAKVPQPNTSSRDLQKNDIFHALQYLKRVCNHPKLVVTQSHPKFAAIGEELKKKNASLSEIEYSTKILALKQLLMDCAIGECNEANSGFSVLNSIVAPHRALIFCQLKAMIDIIENDLLKKHLPSVTYLRLDGSVPINRRHKLVEKFNSDPSIDLLLLTTHIGGLGLNLTGADTVIFVEHDWNPMKDLQAMDRAHRIGQKRTVNVYRLITKRTIEEKIMNLQKFKLVTAKTVISDDNSSLVSMGTDQLLDLFTMNNDERPVCNDATQNYQKCKSLNDVISNLPELSDKDQYSEQYDLDEFLKKLPK